MSAAASSSLLSANSARARNVSAFASPARACAFFGSSRSARSYSPSASATLPDASAVSPCDERRSTSQRDTLPPEQAVTPVASATAIANAALLLLMDAMSEEEPRDICDHPRGRAEEQLREHRSRDGRDDEIQQHRLDVRFGPLTDRGLIGDQR